MFHMKILVAASRNHETSTELATAFPWPEKAEILVVSVAEEMHPIAVGVGPDAIDLSGAQLNLNADAGKSALGVARQFQSRGFQAAGIAIEGDPVTAIVEQAKKWRADLIVVGSHDRSLVERLLVGSVSDKLVKLSPCSVLVVKHHVAA